MPDIRVSFTLNSLLPWKALYLPACFHKSCRNVVSLRPQLLGPVQLESKQEGMVWPDWSYVGSYKLCFHRKTC